MKKQRRVQTPKSGNREMAIAFQELRRSNATAPIGGKGYKRPKAGSRGRDW